MQFGSGSRDISLKLWKAERDGGKWLQVKLQSDLKLNFFSLENFKKIHTSNTLASFTLFKKYLQLACYMQDTVLGTAGEMRVKDGTL